MSREQIIAATAVTVTMLIILLAMAIGSTYVR